MCRNKIKKRLRGQTTQAFGLAVIDGEIFVEGGGLGNGGNVQILVGRVDTAQLLLAHSGGSKAQYAVTNGDQPPGIGAGRQDVRCGR